MYVIMAYTRQHQTIYRNIERNEYVYTLEEASQFTTRAEAHLHRQDYEFIMEVNIGNTI
jgi:hypothetical protein